LPVGLNPAVARRQAQKFFIEPARAKRQIVEWIQQNDPTGKSPQMPVKPLSKKYSDFQKSQISL
jgi:hypothetical protein